ncbi:MAG: FHA domain-containing protein [Myxococcota bacterium]
MDERGFLVRIAVVPPGSPVEAGTVRAVHQDSITIGRSPDADVVLMDPTVSRRHVRLQVTPAPTVEALTASNGTFLDEQRLEQGDPVPIPDAGGRLQVGGIVLVIAPIGETRPVWDVIRGSVEAPPVLEATWDAGQCVIRCGGRPLPLTGVASRMLGALAESPGGVVHHWDLQQVLGTSHLAPLATAVRRALAAAVEARFLDVEQLRIWRATLGSEPDGDDSIDELMRWLVQARRGHGYVLNLPPEVVKVHSI